MVHQTGMGYGIWESLAHLAGNQLGGHEKVWVTGVYGLSQVWIKTEATVHIAGQPPYKRAHLEGLVLKQELRGGSQCFSCKLRLDLHHTNFN